MEPEERSSVATIVGAVVVILAVGALYYFYTLVTKPSITPTPTPTPTPTQTVAAAPTFMLASQNNSGQTGTVKIEEVEAQVRVTVLLDKKNSGSEPAHIHTGSCPTPGSVVYPLENVVDGISVTMLDTTIAELHSKGTLAINLHKSSKETNVYVACANLNW